ncbi:hypothetical protein EA58_09945 [Photobacterium galatheae]|uniref:Uncharacterized protein n=1 Tax=Photobacterium galatheae TaxID=1654360 RepID=A0A066RMY8_9GAMM|nr:hypothetical protein EA58_09945 [Photobacterium galatheae]
MKVICQIPFSPSPATQFNLKSHWIPAFAGMTEKTGMTEKREWLKETDNRKERSPFHRVLCSLKYAQKTELAGT